MAVHAVRKWKDFVRCGWLKVGLNRPALCLRTERQRHYKGLSLILGNDHSS